MGSHFSLMLTIFLIALMAICLAVWDRTENKNERMHEEENLEDDK